MTSHNSRIYRFTTHSYFQFLGERTWYTRPSSQLPETEPRGEGGRGGCTVRLRILYIHPIHPIPLEQLEYSAMNLDRLAYMSLTVTTV